MGTLPRSLVFNFERVYKKQDVQGKLLMFPRIYS